MVRSARGEWLDMGPNEHTPQARVRALSGRPPTQAPCETLLLFEKCSLDEAMRARGGDWSARGVELHELSNSPITLAAYDGVRLGFNIEFDSRQMEEGAVLRMPWHLRMLLERT
jgi:hypothetical protein